MPEGSVFSEYARYYDLLYKDKKYEAEADYLNGMIHRYRPAAKSILELGAGTGRHAVLLADRGYRVHGIERAEEMLARARQLVADRKRQDPGWCAPMFSAADIREVDVHAVFDIVMSVFHVISYQTSNDDVVAAFRTARKHLNEGGLFIFDVWYGPAVLTDRPAVRVKRMGDDQIEVTRLAEPVLRPNEDVVEVNYHVFIRDKKTGQVTETREAHLVRYFFRPELAAFLSQEHFDLLHSEEWMTGMKPGSSTWGVCFVARACAQLR